MLNTTHFLVLVSVKIHSWLWLHSNFFQDDAGDVEDEVDLENDDELESESDDLEPEGDDVETEEDELETEDLTSMEANQGHDEHEHHEEDHGKVHHHRHSKSSHYARKYQPSHEWSTSFEEDLGSGNEINDSDEPYMYTKQSQIGIGLLW